eukprot:gene20997-27855_t
MDRFASHRDCGLIIHTSTLSCLSTDHGPPDPLLWELVRGLPATSKGRPPHAWESDPLPTNETVTKIATHPGDAREAAPEAFAVKLREHKTRRPGTSSLGVSGDEGKNGNRDEGKDATMRCWRRMNNYAEGCTAPAVEFQTKIGLLWGIVGRPT